MRIVLLGGTGRTGALVLARLLADGHGVTTFGRRSSPGAGFAARTGDLADPATLASVLEGQEALINCLQTPGKPPLCSQIAGIVANLAPGLRYVSIGGAGVDRPGDAKGLADRLVDGLLRLMQPHVLADRQREVEILAGSPLRWTMLRPPMLSDGPALGRYALSFDRPANLRITRSDLASAVVAVLEDAAMEGKAPFVSAPGRV